MNGQLICPSFFDGRENNEPKINGGNSSRTVHVPSLRLTYFLPSLRLLLYSSTTKTKKIKEKSNLFYHQKARKEENMASTSSIQILSKKNSDKIYTS